jgi:hypothetical protein
MTRFTVRITRGGEFVDVVVFATHEGPRDGWRVWAAREPRTRTRITLTGAERAEAEQRVAVVADVQARLFTETTRTA